MARKKAVARDGALEERPAEDASTDELEPATRDLPLPRARAHDAEGLFYEHPRFCRLASIARCATECDADAFAEIGVSVAAPRLPTSDEARVAQEALAQLASEHAELLRIRRAGGSADVAQDRER